MLSKAFAAAVTAPRLRFTGLKIKLSQFFFFEFFKPYGSEVFFLWPDGSRRSFSARRFYTSKPKSRKSARRQHCARTRTSRSLETHCRHTTLVSSRTDLSMPARYERNFTTKIIGNNKQTDAIRGKFEAGINRNTKICTRFVIADKRSNE